jgi:molybdenum cofactor guanylyltransferase
MSTAHDPIDPQEITGLILAGGRGTRMGGVDKGLQPFDGTPLAMHALLRLGPQVGSLMINANRNLSAYESMGVPVWPDAEADYAGPLAGWLAGLERCDTAFMVTVPCDSPNFPTDLVQRLAQALIEADAQIAMAVTIEDGQRQPQPVFSLMRSTVLESLVAYLHGGGRKIDRWTAQHACVEVLFDDAAAFANANTLEELQRLHPQHAPTDRP